MRWSPDGQALYYVTTVGNVDNVWLLPLDGAPASGERAAFIKEKEREREREHAAPRDSSHAASDNIYYVVNGFAS